MTRRAPATASCLVTLFAAFATAVPALAVTCQPVNGHSATQIFGGPACASPVGLCTTGNVVGGLQGSLDVVVASTDPTHPDTPTVIRFIGQSLITTKDGDTLQGIDVGAIDTSPADPANGRVGTLLTWTGGMGRYAGASGHIVINGTVDFVAGTVVTDYRGDICTE